MVLHKVVTERDIHVDYIEDISIQTLFGLELNGIQFEPQLRYFLLLSCGTWYAIIGSVGSTSVGLQLVVDQTAITKSTEEVVKTTECHHQDGARNDI